MSDLTIQSANSLQIGIQAAPQLGSQNLAGRLATLRALGAQSEANSSMAASPRLVKAAHEFEAQMMKELLAPLQSGKDTLSGDEDSENSNSALTEFASEALGKAISEHGGLGIAKRILHQLSSSNHSGNAPVMAVGNATAPNSPLK